MHLLHCDISLGRQSYDPAIFKPHRRFKRYCSALFSGLVHLSVLRRAISEIKVLSALVRYIMQYLNWGKSLTDYALANLISKCACTLESHSPF